MVHAGRKAHSTGPPDATSSTRPGTGTLSSFLTTLRSVWPHMVVGCVFGLANLVFNATAISDMTLVGLDWTIMVAVAVLLTLLPLTPLPASIVYVSCWTGVLLHPTAWGTDLLLTTFGFFFLIARLLSVRIATALAVLTVSIFVLTASARGLTSSDVFYIGIFVTGAITLMPLGMLMRHNEEARRADIERATVAQERMRLEIAREMHDLVAYSMSQTALRAQRASLETAYPPEARAEFAALESTASDALHELRLLLRTLRQTTLDLGQSVSTATGLGGVVTDLSSAVQAISDDVASAGFNVTYRCIGTNHQGRLQATTMSRVAREMGSNIIRHADPCAPVTITLAISPHSIRLVTTNRIRTGTSSLPRSGTGTIGMRERLNAVGGTFTALQDGGSWIVTATIPLTPLAERAEPLPPTASSAPAPSAPP